jgi:hypothetical protein
MNPSVSTRKLYLRQIYDHGASIGGQAVTRRAAHAIHDAMVSVFHDPRRAAGASHHLSALREREKAKRRHAWKRVPKTKM